MNLSLAAIAPEADANWLRQWCDRFGGLAQLTLLPLIDRGAAAELPARIEQMAQTANHATLHGAVLLVQPHSGPWARAAIAQLAAALPVALVTHGLRPAMVRDLLARGAGDFLSWDCGRDEGALRLARLFTRSARTAAPTRAASAGATRAALHPRLAGLVGDSPAFVEQLARIARLAGCDAGLLILGETGTGKDLFAQAIHYLSPRAAHPWVAVNCGALPGELVESELFGHARGAFTSAHASQAGLVAQAQGGTLFLDEVDSLPPLAQVKLLRFLQDKEYRPVGGAAVQRADVRIIAACNSDLAALTARGAFRSDLYYRLNVLTVALPALRERGADVVALAEHFVRHFARRHVRSVRALADDARAALLRHHWPGNVRELEHAIERGVLMADGALLHAGDLGLPAAPPAAAHESFQAAKARAIETFERAAIEQALAASGGNIAHAAAAVAKNRRAFWQLMRKYGVDSARFRGDDDPGGWHKG